MQTVEHDSCEPDDSCTVLSQTEGIGAGIAFLFAVAFERSVVCPAERTHSVVDLISRDPDSPGMVFNDGINSRAVRAGQVARQSAIFPARQAFRCPNPQTPVAGAKDAIHYVAGQGLVVRWRPGTELDSVKAEQIGTVHNPDVSVGRLRDRVGITGKAVLRSPGRVPVL